MKARGGAAEAPPALCPLCGEPNDCALAAGHGHPCWCASEAFPAALLDRVPEANRRRHCICRRCLEAARAAGSAQ